MAAWGESATIFFINDIIQEDCYNPDDGTMETNGLCDSSNYIALLVLGIVLQLTVATLLAYFLHSGRYNELQVTLVPVSSIHLDEEGDDVEKSGRSNAAQQPQSME